MSCAEVCALIVDSYQARSRCVMQESRVLVAVRFVDSIAEGIRVSDGVRRNI